MRKHRGNAIQTGTDTKTNADTNKTYVSTPATRTLMCYLAWAFSVSCCSTLTHFSTTAGSAVLKLMTSAVYCCVMLLSKALSMGQVAPCRCCLAPVHACAYVSPHVGGLCIHAHGRILMGILVRVCACTRARAHTHTFIHTCLCRVPEPASSMQAQACARTCATSASICINISINMSIRTCATPALMLGLLFFGALVSSARRKYLW